MHGLDEESDQRQVWMTGLCMAEKGSQPGRCSYPVSPDFRPGLFVVGDATAGGYDSRRIKAPGGSRGTPGG